MIMVVMESLILIKIERAMPKALQQSIVVKSQIIFLWLIANAMSAAQHLKIAAHTCLNLFMTLRMVIKSEPCMVPLPRIPLLQNFMVFIQILLATLTFSLKSQKAGSLA